MDNNGKIIGAIVVITIVVLGTILLFGGNNGSSSTSTVQPSSNITGTKDLVSSNSQTTGPNNAKVTLVEFADFECPACAAASPVLSQLRTDYKGKVQFVFRHFPLPQHGNATIASQAAEAAGLQDKFWEMDNTLYGSQNDWASETNPQATFEQYATKLGLDLTKFKADINSQTVVDKVAFDKASAELIGVKQTPTIYINGQSFTDEITYANVKKVLDKDLK